MTEYERLRAAIDRRSATDPGLRAILRRIDKGTATFADTAEYSRICAEIMGRELSGAVLELADREGVCTQLLRDGYEDINDICGTVQRSLDENKGLHIAPQKAAFPAERVRQIAHSLVDPTFPDETIQRRAGKSVGNVYFSFHDAYIKENAKFRNDAGLKCYITRIVSADACKWCAEVAGKFRFGDQPEDIFRRHDSCDCTILYDDQVLRGKIDSEGKSTKTWEEIGEVPADFEPTVFTPEQAERLQNERLAGYKGLTSGSGNGIMNTRSNANGQSIDIVEHTDITGKPNSITQVINKKGGIDRNYYDDNGRQYKQVSNNDHGKPKQHPFGKNGEHAHDYTYDKNGELTRGKARNLTDDERKENADIL